MDVIQDLIIIFILIIVFIVLTIRLRYRLLKLWQDVSVKEVVFHKLLLQTTILFYENKAVLQNEDNASLLRKLAKYRKKRLRFLLLKERQDLFLFINTIYNEIEDCKDQKFDILKIKFQDLQKSRRLYNSKVLIYNQTISVFPTRYLAIKMNLQIKEYFG